VDIPTPSTPNDTAVIAVDDVGDQNGLNQAQSPETIHYWGIGETLFLRAADDSSTPWLATGFQIESDLSGATVTIREGVQFQGGFGTLTASDVAWSMNNANAATNGDSIHGQAGDFAGLWGEWTAVDANTITFDFTQFDATWKDDFLNQSGQSFAVFSKKAFDDNGADYSRDNVVATGPFEVESWDRDDQVTIVSRYASGGQHYLPELTPKTNRIQFVEVIEPTSRAALLRTGEVDAALLEPKDAIGFINGGFGQTGTSGSVQLGVFFSGNLWEDVDARTGEPLPTKATFVHDIPWIGSPGQHNGGTPNDDMEQARLVRRALAVAIDRDQVNQSLLGGLGVPVHVEYFSTSSPNWDSKWEYPYDPQEAIDILSNQIVADYQQGGASKSELNGNAFEVSLYAGPELGGGTAVTGEVVDAVAGYWAQIGLTTFSLKFSYQTFRPGVVGRSNVHPWITSCDKGRESNPWHFPKGLVQTTLTRGGFSCGLESPQILDLYQRMATAPDQATARAAANEYLDYVYFWNLQPGVVAVPNDVFFNPDKIAAWPMGKSATSAIGDVWNLELK
jgi:ABC-type transport system substrate-binding protein